MLPNIYGEGALFAFSALEGISTFTNDLPGILIKDKVGIKFYSSEIRTLLNNHPNKKCSFQAVTSDYIDYLYENKRYVFLYIKKGVIVGLSDSISVEGNFQNIIKNNILVQKTKGETSLLYKNKGRFVFVYAKTLKEANKLLNENIHFNLEALIKKKINFLNKNVGENYFYPLLAKKCLSVMKSQIYSPEGVFTSFWSTPDRLPHRRMWLWDSIFHSIGFRNFNIKLAKDLILVLFAHQAKNGFIPHMHDPYKHSKISQPPLIMYGAFKIFERDKDLKFLKNVYEHNKLFLAWINKARRYVNDIYLYSWDIGLKVTSKCDESGMDNSSRFDTNDRLFAIDFSSYMANETRLMSKAASLLGNKEDVEYYDKLNKLIVRDINNILYSPIKHFYFDYNIDKKEIHEVYSVSSFLPLFAFATTPIRAKEIVSYLHNEKYFHSKIMIPTIAKSDPTYDLDLWRGPVWINYNYMIREGLINYHFFDEAEEIKSKTIKVMDDVYLKTGVIFEYYDPDDKILPMNLNRKGKTVFPYDFKVKMQTIRDYGWSSTLLFDLLHK